MVRDTFFRALMTGLFCAGFAVLVRFTAPMLGLIQVMMISMLSGFLGSLFASYVQGSRK